MYRLNFCTQIP